MHSLFSDVMFWIGAVCCVVAQIAIVRSTLHRYQPAPENDRVPRPRTAIEVAWVLLPALGLAAVFALTWQAMHQPPAPTGLQISASAPARTPAP